MDKTINFTSCERVWRNFGVSDWKFLVKYNNSIFPQSSDMTPTSDDGEEWDEWGG